MWKGWLAGELNGEGGVRLGGGSLFECVLLFCFA